MESKLNDVPQRITQEEKNKFKNSWSLKYIEKLKEKKTLLIEIINSDYDPDKKPTSLLKKLNLDIELSELENKIFWEEVAFIDWINRANSQRQIDNADLNEAVDNIDKLIGIAKAEVSNWLKVQMPIDSQFIEELSVKDFGERLRRISEKLNQFETVNIHDNAQLVQFYKSLKVEMQKFNLIK